MELPPFSIDEFNKWKEGKIIVKETDMDPVVEQEAKYFVSGGIEKATSSLGVDIEAACKFVKENMDRQFGPTFHCVMGEGFSFEVTRQANTSLYMFYSGRIAVLLFKC